MTREEDIWTCTDCGQLQGRHDCDFENEKGEIICGECITRILTPEEKVRVEVECVHLRHEIKRDNHIMNINGSFCSVEFYECDEDSIILKVKFGTADDTGSCVTEEDIELDRETFEIINWVTTFDSGRFLDYINSDNVIKVSDNGYKTQCTLYRKEFTYEELKEYFKKEYQN